MWSWDRESGLDRKERKKREYLRKYKRRRYAEDPEYRAKMLARGREHRQRKRAEDPEYKERQEEREQKRRERETPVYKKRKRERDRESRKDRRSKGRALIAEFRRDGCIACEEMGPYCLVAHHRNPNTKDFHVSAGVNKGGYSMRRIQAELAKCDCLCANCHHKLLPHNENGKLSPKQALVAEFRRNGCALCGESNPRCLVAHHWDPDTKDFSISVGVKSGYSTERVQTELEKCVCLCANCHRKLHAGKLAALGENDKRESESNPKAEAVS